MKERIFRDEMLKERRRPDGRAFDEIRKIDFEVGVLPRTHGSALFTRGETQALVTATLGTKDDEQRIEMLDLTETSKRFMLHYNFPPFSVGEVGFMRGPGRREIGHGALAERSLSAVIPDDKKFPYTMRVVSDILESNGSSSMATVCGGDTRADGCGRADRRTGGGHRHGPGDGRQGLRHPHRHRRRRGSLRRHGFQSRRIAPGHHRPADGHQGPERHHQDHEGGAGAGQRRAPVHPGQDDRHHRDAARRNVAVCAAHLHAHDSDRQDSRSDRAGRQDDPQHRRRDRREDRRRRRRHR